MHLPKGGKGRERERGRDLHSHPIFTICSSPNIGAPHYATFAICLIFTTFTMFTVVLLVSHMYLHQSWRSWFLKSDLGSLENGNVWLGPLLRFATATRRSVPLRARFQCGGELLDAAQRVCGDRPGLAQAAGLQPSPQAGAVKAALFFIVLFFIVFTMYLRHLYLLPMIFGNSQLGIDTCRRVLAAFLAAEQSETPSATQRAFFVRSLQEATGNSEYHELCPTVTSSWNTFLPHAWPFCSC